MEPIALLGTTTLGGSLWAVMRYHRCVDVTWELADDRAVILDARGSTLTTLNPVGTLIWDYLDVAREPHEVAGHLVERFPGVDPARAHQDAEAFIGRLLDDGLLVPAGDG
jgi:hypothetical protein